MNDRSIRHDSHAGRIALGLGALLVAAALLAPVAARADRNAHSGRQSMRHRPHGAAVVGAGPRGRLVAARARLRSERSGPRLPSRRSEARWARRRRAVPPGAARRYRFGSRNALHRRFQQRCADRDDHFRDRAPGTWSQVTWRWPFPR